MGRSGRRRSEAAGLCWLIQRAKDVVEDLAAAPREFAGGDFVPAVIVMACPSAAAIEPDPVGIAADGRAIVDQQHLTVSGAEAATPDPELLWMNRWRVEQIVGSLPARCYRTGDRRCRGRASSCASSAAPRRVRGAIVRDDQRRGQEVQTSASRGITARHVMASPKRMSPRPTRFVDHGLP